jgi:hypothetical protein
MLLSAKCQDADQVGQGLLLGQEKDIVNGEWVRATGNVGMGSESEPLGMLEWGSGMGNLECISGSAIQTLRNTQTQTPVIQNQYPGNGLTLPVNCRAWSSILD